MLLNLSTRRRLAIEFNLNRLLTIMKTCLAGRARCGEYNPDTDFAQNRSCRSYTTYLCLFPPSYFGNDSTMKSNPSHRLQL